MAGEAVEIAVRVAGIEALDSAVRRLNDASARAAQTTAQQVSTGSTTPGELGSFPRSRKFSFSREKFSAGTHMALMAAEEVLPAVSRAAGGEPDTVSSVLTVAGSMASGAMMGSVFGPVGTAVGVVIGLVTGLVAVFNDQAEAEEAAAREAEKLNEKLHDMAVQAELAARKEAERQRVFAKEVQYKTGAPAELVQSFTEEMAKAIRQQTGAPPERAREEAEDLAQRLFQDLSEYLFPDQLAKLRPRELAREVQAAGGSEAVESGLIAAAVIAAQRYGAPIGNMRQLAQAAVAEARSRGVGKTEATQTVRQQMLAAPLHNALMGALAPRVDVAGIYAAGQSRGLQGGALEQYVAREVNRTLSQQYGPAGTATIVREAAKAVSPSAQARNELAQLEDLFQENEKKVLEIRQTVAKVEAWAMFRAQLAAEAAARKWQEAADKAEQMSDPSWWAGG